MPKFESGAIRSDSAENEAYYLISPIAWSRLAKIYSIKQERFTDLKFGFSQNLNEALDHLIIYLSGDRSIDNLAYALFRLFEAFDLEELGHHQIWEEFDARYRYDAISPIGLRRLAERYRIGEKKYAAYNCENGMPVHDLLNHAIRHIEMHIAGNEDEPGDDNLGGVAWGICMAMHSEEMWPELNKAHLRGPNCSLTPDILKSIDKRMNKRKRN